MTTWARSAEHESGGTRVGTQGHITSRLGRYPRRYAGDNPEPTRLRKRFEPERTFIGSVCRCGQHPRAWTIAAFLRAWEMGRKP